MVRKKFEIIKLIGLKVLFYMAMKRVGNTDE